MIIELDKYEAGRCQLEAANRHMAFTLFHKDDPEMLAKINSVDAHAAHCKAELAAAKAIGSNALQIMRDKVLAGHVRVRGKPGQGLLVGMQENPGLPLIHTLMLDNNVYEVFGWAYAGESRKPQWLKRLDDFYAYEMPAESLHDIKTFPRVVLGHTPEMP